MKSKEKMRFHIDRNGRIRTNEFNIAIGDLTFGNKNSPSITIKKPGSNEFEHIPIEDYIYSLAVLLKNSSPPDHEVRHKNNSSASL